MTGEPSNSVMRCESRRAVRSVLPPGAKGTTIFTVRAGHVCAQSGPAEAKRTTAAKNERIRGRIRKLLAGRQCVVRAAGTQCAWRNWFLADAKRGIGPSQGCYG